MKKKATEDLIKETTLELLQTHSIIEISVRMISTACDISTNTFYYYYKDKNDVVSSIYLNRMKKYLNVSLIDWYESIVEFIKSDIKFFKNTMCYNEQNCLADTMIDLDRKKLASHIKPEVLEDENRLNKMKMGMEYLLHGSVGFISYALNNDDANAMINIWYAEDIKTWDYLISCFPPNVMDCLSANPTNSVTL